MNSYNVDIIKEIVELYISSDEYEIVCDIEHINNKPSSFNFDNFKSLFNIIDKTCDNNTIDWSKLGNSHTVEFYFENDITGRYNLSGPPVFFLKTLYRKAKYLLKERNIYIHIKLYKIKNVELFNNLVPKSVKLIENSSYVYKQHWVYDFVKFASGKDKELACKDIPNFNVIIRLNRSIIQFGSLFISNHIIEKTLDLAGRYDKNNNLTQFTITNV